jgi:hypothetical protein
MGPFVQDVRVDHGGADVLVTQKFLDRSRVRAFESPRSGCRTLFAREVTVVRQAHHNCDSNEPFGRAKVLLRRAHGSRREFKTL